VLVTALAVLEDEGLASVTIRALARRLGVDPMALYHYFDDRDELLVAAAARAYGELVVRPPPRGSWRAGLTALADDYVGLLARSGELLRYVTTNARAAALPTALFAERFHAVTAPLRLSQRNRRMAHDAFVDLLHGFSIAVPRSGLAPAMRRQLRGELAIVFAGIASLCADRETR
jgi:AcrR family transcriptional regulator